MPRTISNVSDQVYILTFLATKQAIHSPNHHLDDIDILPLIETTDIISIRNLTLMENHINRTRMILYIQPVAHILTLTIHRQWLAMTDIIDEQRNQLLRELIRTIIIRAVGHNSRQAISIVESTHKVITACLRSRIWRVRHIFQILSKELLTIS